MAKSQSPIERKTTPQMREVLREFIRHAGNQASAADQLGIPQSELSQSLKGRREISERLAEKLGYRRVYMYEAIQ